MTTSDWASIAVVFVGGGLGALTRFGVENIQWFNHDKYHYTIFINITGCIVIGLLCALFRHWDFPKIAYTAAMTGFLGGYTTYSAFTLDAMMLVQRNMVWDAIVYVMLTFVGGLGGCAIGLFGTEWLLKTFGK